MNLRIFVTLLALLVAGFSLPGQAAPNMKGRACMITTDFYIVHFSAFQPPAKKPETDAERKEAFRPYCHELPRTGTTYFGMDFIDRDVRQMPISMKVVEEKPTAGEEGKPQVVRVVKEVPPTLYPQGVADLRVNFDKPGHYALIIQFGGEDALEEDIMRVPLTVALSSPWKHIPFLKYAAVAAIVVFFTMVIFFISHFRGARKATQA
ncbi:hypothetical protein MIN45_P0716 [Methylomarinovum tepidoasis]|uniref:Uncharacterized protein n=1 Tax=Methylomarinovum tepidoasis TaxID=2840183 RepID=A0AAU9C4D8_9GAMM|nr:hypothetical protein [Methylomarinovum sp. IN45]BCX88347.1 hypothetical protein MIN45_P0716 [Methylomarinovum sp. IN45]